MGLKKDLSAIEICEIIETCAEHQVTTLQWGDLKVSWEHHPRKGDSPLPGVTAPPPNQLNPETDFVDAELDLKEEQHANLLINDPRRLEELIDEGELEDVDSTDDDESAE